MGTVQLPPLPKCPLQEAWPVKNFAECRRVTGPHNCFPHCGLRFCHAACKLAPGAAGFRGGGSPDAAMERHVRNGLLFMRRKDPMKHVCCRRRACVQIVSACLRAGVQTPGEVSLDKVHLHHEWAFGASPKVLAQCSVQQTTTAALVYQSRKLYVFGSVAPLSPAKKTMAGKCLWVRCKVATRITSPTSLREREKQAFHANWARSAVKTHNTQLASSTLVSV